MLNEHIFRVGRSLINKKADREPTVSKSPTKDSLQNGEGAYYAENGTFYHYKKNNGILYRVAYTKIA